MIQIPGFQMIRQLGDGGAAYVYHAINPEQNRHVALKVLKPEHERKPGVVRRFKDEAHIAAKLKHDAIVTLYGSSTRQAPYWIEYEYLGGGTLRDRLARGRLPLPEALRIFFGLCAALDHAHRRSVIHRDLKPGNILFDQENKPYLTDFGISKDLEQTGHTRYGAQLGTPAYMSPEQTWGHPTTRTTDVWSLGVMLFEMLTGRLPFPGPDAVLVHQIRHDMPVSLSQLASVPPGLEPVLNRALHKDPNQRYRTVAEFAGAVQAALPAPSRPTPTPPSGVTPVPGEGLGPVGKRWLLMALVTVVVAALVVTGVMLKGGCGPTSITSTTKVKVPNVSGFTVTEAKAALVGFEVAEKEVSANQRRDSVVRTEPRAGTEVEPKSKVTLLVSRGPAEPPPPKVKVPDVRGFTVTRAKAELADFAVVGERTVASNQRKGLVVGTEPQADTQVEPKSEITLLVSRGPAPPPPAIVPGVVGLSAGRAQSELKAAGLRWSEQERNDSRPSGQVIDQSPAAGRRVARHTVVTLYVSNGPPPPAPPPPAPPPGM